MGLTEKEEAFIKMIRIASSVLFVKDERVEDI